MSSPEEPAQRDVLSSLPRTRPQRRSAKRDGPAAKPQARRAPAKPKATARAAPKPTRKTAPKPTAKSTPKPTATAAPKASPRPAHPPAEPRSVEPPTRTDVLAGAAETATELVKAGLAVGGELVRVALSRLPRP